ncbi:MAG TPA: hypothetical protein DEH10_16140 [Pseudomonas sp.]|nr:hypothetical protein [Pseudomonas sp.]
MLPPATQKGRGIVSKLRDFFKGLFEEGKLLAITQGNLVLDVQQGTRRFTEEELRRYEYRIAGGYLLNVEGVRLSSTILAQSHDKSGMAAFVIAADDRVYIFNHFNKADRVAHSSFVGKFAKGAGEIMVSKGKIKLVHAHSGHFRPNALNIYRVVEYFNGLGALAVDAKVGFVTNPFPDIGKTPPTYAASVLLTCVLDRQERETLAACKASVEQAKSQLAVLGVGINQESLELYRLDQLRELEESVNQIKAVATEELLPLFAGQLKRLDEEASGVRGMTLEDYRKVILRKINKLEGEIEDNQSLIDALNNKRETISVVYGVAVFLQFVEENWDALRGQLKPAFYTM